MLTVYTVQIPKDPSWIDLSSTPLAELVDAALAVLSHQKTATVWFGYLEGFMLTPQEETRLRPVLRAFSCHLVCTLPFLLPYAWKTDVEAIYTVNPNGGSDSHNHGGPVLDGRAPGHNDARGAPAADDRVPEAGKARRPQARRVQKGPHSAPRKTKRPEANDGVRTQ